MLIGLVKKGSADKSVTIRIVDSTDGTPETGVVFNTSGIDLWYRREGADKVSITEATLAALTTAHADGGFLHIGDGYYRLDLPDAAFATGATHVVVGGTVTGMVVIGGVVQLVDFDFDDAVRGGLTALPNAAAGATGGLALVDSTGAVKVQARLKKNAAGGLLVPFQMTDSTTHNPVAGKTVSVTRSLDGAAFAGIAGTVTEMANGWYYAALTAADINANVTALEASATGCDVTPLVIFNEP